MSAVLAPAAQRTRKRRGEGPSRRPEILAAATRIFVEEGIASATMRRIAAAVGLSPTALYVYFPDKSAILQAIAERAFAELVAALRASQRATASPEEQLRASLQAYIAFGLSHPDAYRLTLLSDVTSLPEPPCRSIEDADVAFAFLVRNVAEMMEAGLFRPAPPVPVAEAIWAALHGLVALLLDHREHLTSPAEALVQHVVDMAVAGFR